MTLAAAAKKASRADSERIDDVSVAAQVRLALLLHRSTSAVNTTVKVKKGIVTLTGKTKDSAEKNLVTKLVKDVNGVKGVQNRMVSE